MNIFSFKWAIKCRMYRSLLKIVYRGRIQFGEKFTFRDGLHVIIEDKGSLKIGDRVFFNNYCSVNVLNKVTIGNDCLFGENVKIYDHNHGFKIEDMPFNAQPFKTSEIEIGHNCWFGSNVIILKGVHIGNNCVIAAGTIVKDNIEDGTILYSNGEKRKLILKK